MQVFVISRGNCKFAGMSIEHIIIDILFVWIMVPIQRRVYRQISRKWLAYALTFLIGLLLLSLIYWLWNPTHL